MKELTEAKQTLTNDERNLLSVAYKNVVGARRSAWRVVSSLQSKEETEVGKEYLKKIKAELKEKCDDVLVSVIMCINYNFVLCQEIFASR